MDEFIRQSPNGLIYSTPVFLDNMCPGWSAVVSEDYSWVLPVTHNKKYLVNYLYQPSFCQQAGVAVRDETVAIPWDDILEFLKTKFRFWEITFNYAAKPLADENIEINEATNFIIPLHDSYLSIREHYKKDLQKNLKRSHRFRLAYKPAEYAECIDEYKKHYAERMKHVTDADYDRFKKMCETLVLENKVICRKAVSQQNELMATILLLSDGKRLYNMMNTTTEAGRKVEANHYLVDAALREFAGQDLLFDFEGSDLPGVKSFYENFGAVNQPYFMVKYNNLPYPHRLFK